MEAWSGFVDSLVFLLIPKSKKRNLTRGRGSQIEGLMERRSSHIDSPPSLPIQGLKEQKAKVS
jgi:hypothetical protein